MNYITWANIIITLIAIVTVVYSWRIFQITKAKSVFCICFAMLLGVVNRIFILCKVSTNITTPISLSFWLLWVVGLYLLYKVLRKYIK